MNQINPTHRDRIIEKKLIQITYVLDTAMNMPVVVLCAGGFGSYKWEQHVGCKVQ